LATREGVLMPNTKANFDTYPFKDDNVGGSPTSNQRPELKVTTLASSDFNDSNKFSFHQNRGTLKFVNIRETIKNTFSTSSFVIPDTHTTKFIVKNDTTLTINRPLTLRRKSDDKIFIPEELTALPFSMSFEGVTTTPETSSTYQTSYADITIGNLRTFSGDVHKVKLFTRQQDKQNSEFEKVGEFVLESKNTLVDESSPTADDPIGIFYSQSVIDNHWVSSSNTTTANNSLIMNAALISGSNRGVNDYVEFKTKDRFELEKGEEYILSFSGYYIKGDKVQSDGDVRKSTEIEVLLSGSVVSQTEDTISIGSIGDVGDSSSELFKGNVSGSIPYLYNYFYTHKKSGAKPKAGLVFRVHAGQFHLSNIKFEAVSEQNFNPGFYKTKVPMPTSTRRGQRYDFVSEFYDFNNNKSDIEAATSASVLFAGPKQVLADGTDAVLSGSVLVGESIEMYGVNPAYLRSVGYNGFDKTLAGTGDRDGGFMLFSGSVGTAIGASETYNGVGIEIVQKGANPHQNSFLQFASDYKGTGQSRFRVQTDEFLLGRSGSGTAGDTFISGSEGKLRISSSNFHLDTDGSVTMQGTITAEAGGTIGGFTIGSNTLAATNFTLDTSLQSIVLGSGNNILIASASQGLSLGHATFGSAPFRVTPAGVLTATSATIQGAITATSGEIGGFTIDADEIKAGSTLILDSDTNSGQIKLGGATSITAGNDGVYMDGTGDFRVGDADGNRISFDQSTGTLIMSSSNFMLGSKANGKSFISSSAGGELEISSSFFHLSSSGHITGSKVLFEGGKIARWTIDGDKLESVNASNKGIILDADASSPTIEVREDDNNRIRIFHTTANDFGIIGTQGGNNVFLLGDPGGNGNKISSWAFNDKRLSSFTTSTQDKLGISLDADTQLITIHGDSGDGQNNVGGNNRDNVMVAIGQLTSNQFGIKGFTDGGNRAFELSTTRLEIGGWSFNDTQISSNNLILNSAGIVETSTYVSGLRGFRLSAQDNGFLEVENAKIRGTLRTTVFEKETVNAVGGQLQVGNATVITGSAQISATATQIPVENVSGFTGSEVIMAKKVGNTGFSTEYMLITSQSRRDSTSNTDFSGSLFVVRGYSGSASQSQASGSLGDSPTPATTLEPGQVLVSTGFYNENTNEGSGYIRLNANPNDSSTPFMDIVERTGSAIYDVDLKVRLGDLSGLSSGLVGSNPGFGLFTNKVFLQGNDPTSASIALGSTPPTSVNYTSNAGIYMDGSGDFLVRGDNDNFIKFDVSDKLSIAAEDFELDAGGLKLIGNSATAANNQIRLGSATALNTGDGLFASGDGKFRVGADNGHRLEFDGTNLVVSSSDFFLGSKGSNNAYISSSGNVLEISSSKFALKKNGDVSIEGTVTITGGDLAGIDANSISGSSNEVSASLAASASSAAATGSTLTTDSGSLAARLKLDSNGVDILNSSDVSVAQLTNSLRIGRDAAGQSRLEIDSSGNLSIINRQGSTDTNVIQLLANGNSSFSGSGTFGGAITATSGKIAGWDINSNKLESTNNKVILDGNNNNGEIRLGSSPPTSATNGAGIYLGGDGTFLVGDADGHRVSFENSKLIVSSSTFFLGSKGSANSYISSSGDVLEISSSNFALKKNGEMLIGDDITISTAGASSLNIGTLSGVTDVGDTSTGFVVDSNGNALIKQGGANKNYIQFNGGNVDFRTDTFNLVTTGSGAGEDGGIIMNSTQPLIMVSGSRGSVKGNSVRLLGDEGVLEVSQSGEGVFDTGRTKTFTTSTIIEPVVFKAGSVSKGFVSSSTQTEQAAPSMSNLLVGNIQAGGLIDTNAIFLDTNRSSTAFAMVNDISRTNAATNPDGVAKPTASFAVNHSVNYTANTQNSNCHPAFTFNADYFTELGESATNNTVGWVQNSVPSGSNIFTISTTARDVDNTDFEDAKFNILGLESNTSGLHANRQNEYTFLQAKHSSSIRLQIQHDGDVISKGNITAFGTSFLTVSDEREKKDIYQISESLNRILELRPTKFTWKETNKQDVGFIAQEVEEVIPEVIETSRGFINTEEDMERKTIAYPKLVPYLVDTIQVLTKRIEELEKKVK
jgi:hypothetical protein